MTASNDPLQNALNQLCKENAELQSKCESCRIDRNEAFRVIERERTQNAELRELLTWCFDRVTAAGLPEGAWAKGTYASRISALLSVKES